MKKIPSLFISTEDHKLTREVNPLCQWVIDGEGIATAKLDGTPCAVIDGKLYKRYDNSKLRSRDERVQKTTPLDSWIYCGCNTDRGKFIYWIPVTHKDYYHQIAWAWAQGELEDGTYELVGPEVQGNPHSYKSNMLVMHGSLHLMYPLKETDNPRTYDEIYNFFKNTDTNWEGIVWHHPDGRMAKITRKKFGLPWINEKNG